MICPNCGGYIEMDASDINGCCDTCNTRVEAGQLVSDESIQEFLDSNSAHEKSTNQVKTGSIRDLPIKRDLDEEYRLKEIHIAGMFCSVYQTPTEIIVTDGYDPTKIYQITSREFYYALDEKED